MIYVNHVYQRIGVAPLMESREPFRPGATNICNPEQVASVRRYRDIRFIYVIHVYAVRNL